MYPLRKASAKRVARLYRKRWTLETAFQHLEAYFHSEINTLGYPKAALFGFCLALVAYNMLAVVMAALRSVHGEETSGSRGVPLLYRQRHRHDLSRHDDCDPRGGVGRVFIACVRLRWWRHCWIWPRGCTSKRIEKAPEGRRSHARNMTGARSRDMSPRPNYSWLDMAKLASP